MKVGEQMEGEQTGTTIAVRSLSKWNWLLEEGEE